MNAEPGTYDVAILGGGASGLMCAREAARRGRRVAVLEHNDRLGRKILVSGGGHCNFTHGDAGSENYLSDNPDFCKSALARFTPNDFIALVEQHGIAYHEKQPGQFFCNRSSREIIRLLQDECLAAGVLWRLGCPCIAVRRDHGFAMNTFHGTFMAESLVVATGGLSYPDLGASDLGYRIARQFGLKIVEPRPALAPLLWSKQDRERFGMLSGISFEATVRCGKAAFRDNVLLTHRGLSGPAVLQVSSYWRPGESIELDLFPGGEVLPWLRSRAGSAAGLGVVLGEILPRRFAQAWCQQQALSRPIKPKNLIHKGGATRQGRPFDSDFDGGDLGRRRMKCFAPAELEAVARRLHSWKVRPAGDEGFGSAEVTRGGVDTRELSSRTMEARRIPGLFFIGEVVDVTGWLGGYNLQWAWASGHAAGQAA